jgi:hypothetical protein
MLARQVPELNAVATARSYRSSDCCTLSVSPTQPAILPGAASVPARHRAGISLLDRDTESVYANYITLQCASQDLSTAARSKLSGHSSQRHGQVQHLATPAHQAATTHAPHATARPSNAAA